MREDFNKLLTERERIGHSNKFRAVRSNKDRKSADEDGMPIRTREGMKRNYNGWTDRKSFNENLNPLINLLSCAVGKNWDKVHSEICQNFDRRKVVNDHIFQHLFQFVKVKTFMLDGKVCTQGYRGIEEAKDLSPSEFYVDPRDGRLMRGQGKTWKAQARERIDAARDERAKNYRVINRDEELHLIDGVWFHFTWKDLPDPIVTTVEAEVTETDNWALHGKQVNKVGSKTITRKVNVTDELTRNTFCKGEDPHVSMISGERYDAGGRKFRSHPDVIDDLRQIGRYRAEKKTASKKVLKKAGV